MDETVKAELERIHDEDARQNHRLNDLEETVKQINELVLSVQRISISVEALTKEVQKQGQRLEKIENAPLERVNSISQTVITTITGIIIGALATGLLQMIAQNL